MSEAPRDMLAKGVIALSICVGGYLMAVAPVKEKLAAQRATGAGLALQVRDAEGVRDQVPALSAALQRTTSDAERFLRLGELARNERQLYAGVMAAAEKNRVQIDTLSPSRGTASAPRQARPDSPFGERDLAIGYQISATGAYANVAAFLASLQNDLGFAMVRSVTLHARSHQSDQVQANIETIHFSFDPGPVTQAERDRIASVPEAH